MKSAMLSHVQTLQGAVPIAVGFVRYSPSQIPTSGLPSSRAHVISHSSPSALGVLAEMSAITPSLRLMRARVWAFQAEPYGSLTLMSTYSNVDFVFRDWPLSRFLLDSSSLAKAMNTTFLSGIWTFLSIEAALATPGSQLGMRTYVRHYQFDTKWRRPRPDPQRHCRSHRGRSPGRGPPPERRLVRRGAGVKELNDSPDLPKGGSSDGPGRTIRAWPDDLALSLCLSPVPWTVTARPPKVLMSWFFVLDCTSSWGQTGPRREV